MSNATLVLEILREHMAGKRRSLPMVLTELRLSESFLVNEPGCVPRGLSPSQLSTIEQRTGVPTGLLEFLFCQGQPLKITFDEGLALTAVPTHTERRKHAHLGDIDHKSRLDELRHNNQPKQNLEQLACMACGNECAEPSRRLCRRCVPQGK